MIYRVPKYIKRKITSAFRNKESSFYPDYFPIWDRDVNLWLTTLFGLHTGTQDDYNIENAFSVMFDWRTQHWHVTASVMEDCRNEY